MKSLVISVDECSTEFGNHDSVSLMGHRAIVLQRELTYYLD